LKGGGVVAGVRQFDEKRVLALALEVFWRKGWLSTSMEDLAQATDVQRGSLYNAYGSKEALFLLAFEGYATLFLDGARRALEAPDAEQALHQFFELAVRNMSSGSPARGCLTTKTAIDAELIGPRIRQRLRRLLDDLHEVVRAAFARDSFAPKLALGPDEAADVVVAFTRGLAVMERVYQDRARLRSTAKSLTGLLLQRR
jgi:AcrR family transcriptional regulator